MDLTAKIEAARKKLAEVKARETDEDRSDRAAIKELEDLEAEREEEESKQRELDLDRRMVAARDALGPEAKLEAVAVQNWTDNFIVMGNGKAHAKWQKEIQNAAQLASNSRKDIDRDPINRRYAVQVVYDWNGQTDFDGNTELSKKLSDHLIKNPGLVTPILDAAGRLAGVFAEERKRGT